MSTTKNIHFNKYYNEKYYNNVNRDCHKILNIPKVITYSSYIIQNERLRKFLCDDGRREEDEEEEEKEKEEKKEEEGVSAKVGPDAHPMYTSGRPCGGPFFAEGGARGGGRGEATKNIRPSHVSIIPVNKRGINPLSSYPPPPPPQPLFLLLFSVQGR